MDYEKVEEKDFGTVVGFLFFSIIVTLSEEIVERLFSISEEQPFKFCFGLGISDGAVTHQYN